MLFKKLLRTIKHYKAQFISMILMVTLGIGVLFGFNVEWYTIEQDTNDFFERTGFADYRVVSTNGFSESDTQKIADIDGVDDVTRYFSMNMQRKDSSHLIGVCVTTNANVSGFIVTEGAAYDENDTSGFWLFDKYAKANDINIGDTLTLTYETIELTGEVKGLIEAGEQMIPLQDSDQLMPDFSKYGYVYISPKTFEDTIVDNYKEKYLSKISDIIQESINSGNADIIDSDLSQQYASLISGEQINNINASDIVDKYYSQVNVKSSLSKADFTERLEEAVGETLMVLTKDETVSYSEANGEATEGKTMASILPVLFLAIAILTMITTMQRITANEKTQIGTLKALGFRDVRIIRHYTSFAILIALVGSVVGIILGYGIGYYVMNPNGMMATYIVMDNWSLKVPFWTWFVIIGIDVLMILIGYLSVKNTLKGTAADTLRPYTPKKIKNMIIEKTPLWDKFGFATKWNLRDAMRHKSRTIVTFIGILGCMVMIVATIGMSDTMDNYLNVYYTDVMKYNTKVNISDEADNEKAVELANRLNGDYSASISVQLEDTAYSLDVYNIENDMICFLNENNDIIELPSDGALVSLRIMEKYNLKDGDVITVSPFGTSEKYDIKIAGVARSMSENINVSLEYANKIYSDNNVKLTDSDRYKIGNIYTSESKDNISDDIISTMQTKKEIEETFSSFMGMMYQMIGILIVAAVVLSLVVLYNLGIMSYIERYREMATLKVVGFKDKKISSILISQNIWITVIGIIVGIPAGVGVLIYMIDNLASEYEIMAHCGVLTYTVGPVITFAVSLIVGVMISKKNKHINMVEALKGIE